MKRLAKTIPIALYECKLQIILTDNARVEANKIYRKYKIEPIEGEAEGMLVYIQGKYWLILEHSSITHNCIAHEIFHATRIIAEDREIEEEEAQAWLNGYLTEHMYKFLQSKNIEVRNGPAK